MRLRCALACQPCSAAGLASVEYNDTSPAVEPGQKRRPPGSPGGCPRRRNKRRPERSSRRPRRAPAAATPSGPAKVGRLADSQPARFPAASGRRQAAGCPRRRIGVAAHQPVGAAGCPNTRSRWWSARCREDADGPLADRVSATPRGPRHKLRKREAVGHGLASPVAAQPAAVECGLAVFGGRPGTRTPPSAHRWSVDRQGNSRPAPPCAGITVVAASRGTSSRFPATRCRIRSASSTVQSPTPPCRMTCEAASSTNEATTGFNWQASGQPDLQHALQAFATDVARVLGERGRCSTPIGRSADSPGASLRTVRRCGQADTVRGS